MTLRNLARACQGLVVMALGSACHHEHPDSDIIDERADAEVFEVTIDTDERIDVEPGEGAGVFLEYHGDGRWELFTTCDTEVSDLLCEFDIFLSVPVGERIRDVEGLELEREDQLRRIEGGVVQLLLLTDVDFDRVKFETEPGETVRLDVLIDGIEDPELVFWNGYGSLQLAAPSNPLDLTPSEP